MRRQVPSEGLIKVKKANGTIQIITNLDMHILNKKTLKMRQIILIKL